MSWFSKTNDAKNTTYGASHETWSNFNSSSEYATDDNDSDYEVVFLKELSNGALVFQIINCDFEPAGHIIVSTSSGKTQIIESGFSDFNDNDRNYLRKQVKAICDAINS